MARKAPEHGLQVRACKWIKANVSDDVHWIGGAAGLRLTPQTIMKAKASGCLNRGWPDLSFMVPGGLLYAIELKTGRVPLTTEQEAFRDTCLASGRDMWALCRSLDELIAALTRWNIPLRPEPLPHVGGFLDGLD